MIISLELQLGGACAQGWCCAVRIALVGCSQQSPARLNCSEFNAKTSRYGYEHF
jgi:hypothetical protein